MSASRGWAGTPERGSPALLGAMLWACRHLRAGIARTLVVPVALWFLATSPAARAASRDYLARVLGRPAGALDMARHFLTFAHAVLDRVFLLAGRAEGYDITTEGLHHVADIVAGGRGCVLLGAHLGSFEMLRTLSRLSPVPVRALMFRANAGALTALLDRLAPDLRAGVIEIGDTASMLRVHEAVRRGEIVGILADRTPPGHRQVVVPFLGAPAGFPAGPFILAATLGVPVVLFRAVRVADRRYRISFAPFAERVVLARATRQSDLRRVVSRYADAVAAGCRAHPYNWFNFFAFWELPSDAETSRLGRGDLAGPVSGSPGGPAHPG